jgi:hypothetical protein
MITITKADQETRAILKYLAEENCDEICRYELCPKYYGWFSSDWVLNLILN